jgi:hypothetical protein
MRIPVMAATVERRLLLNYQVDPAVVTPLLPAPLRPRLVGGAAVAGICFIRLSQLRPAGLPAMVGVRTENAAHRIAVSWDDPAGEPPRTGVFIPRRHSASRPTVWFGGRLFPGAHDLARFTVREGDGELRVSFVGGSGTADVTVAEAAGWPGSALFSGLAEASEFFRSGGAGYSATRDAHRLDGLELRTEAWAVQPAVVTHAASTYYDDPALFPPGSARLDVALVMRQLPVTWHGLPSMRVAPQLVTGPTT